MIFYLMLLVTWVLLIREFDLYLDRRKNIKQFVLHIEIDKEIFITAAYDYVKQLVDDKLFSIEELMIVLGNTGLEKDNPIHIGVTRYFNECPVAKFNQLSANNKEDSMTQKVDV